MTLHQHQSDHAFTSLAYAGKMDPKEEHKKTERWYLEDFVF